MNPMSNAVNLRVPKANPDPTAAGRIILETSDAEETMSSTFFTVRFVELMTVDIFQSISLGYRLV